MLRSFNLGTVQWKDKRVIVRVILGVLVAANLATAVIALKPFGGGADDLRRDRAVLLQQLTALQKQIVNSKRLVEKVQTARTEGDEFLDKYVTDKHVVASTLQGELNNIAENSGVAFQPTSWTQEPVEGSDTLFKLTLNAGCQGSYQSLAKFLNLVDRSSRFLIIQSLNATPMQAGDKLNVTLKVDTYIRQQPGEDFGPAPGAGAPPAAEPGGAGL